MAGLLAAGCGASDDPSTRRISDGRLVVSFVFHTGCGGQEPFTYDFLVRDGHIIEVIGRYL